MHNGEADYQRGALAVGVCLGLPEYVRWAVEGPFGINSMLDNNLDRDGQYCETSTLYAAHTRVLYLTFADLLFNYRGSAYPQGVNLYPHPKFRRFLQSLDASLACAGHSPRFGDSSPDTAKITPPPRPFDSADYSSLEHLYAYTDDPAQQRQLATLLNWLADGDADRLRAGWRHCVIKSVGALACRSRCGKNLCRLRRKALASVSRPPRASGHRNRRPPTSCSS